MKERSRQVTEEKRGFKMEGVRIPLTRSLLQVVTLACDIHARCHVMACRHVLRHVTFFLRSSSRNDVRLCTWLVDRMRSLNKHRAPADSLPPYDLINPASSSGFLADLAFIRKRWGEEKEVRPWWLCIFGCGSSIPEVASTLSLIAFHDLSPDGGKLSCKLKTEQVFFSCS